MAPVRDILGEDLLRRADEASEALARERDRRIDPLLDPDHLRGVIDAVGEVSQENIHLRIVAEAAREHLLAEFEDDRFFTTEKLKAAVTSWEAWERQRGGA